jgi:precorrin-6B methylase 2
MGALGAELRLRQKGEDGDPRIRDAMKSVLENLEPGLFDGVEPNQAASVSSRLNFALQDALEFMNDPDRAPGWGYTDPKVLQERGRDSAFVARNIASLGQERPALESALSEGEFLDVGTGVGWLAIEAAKLWPNMRIVGLDIWEPALKLAEANISAEGLQDRITLRRQSVSEIDDDAAFNVIWLPAGFLPQHVVNDALPRLNLALKPGGFLVCGGLAPSSESLSQSLSDLQIIRQGGHPWRVEEITERLNGTGFEDIEYVKGERGNTSRVLARR